jgi:hypothetical protein
MVLDTLIHFEIVHENDRQGSFVVFRANLRQNWIVRQENLQEIICVLRSMQ